ncbi:hypothetical protein [Kocuria salina]|uniref:hypothetical protein n=1 Tax=Kocuria salina TaxID=1929416 RepID=UPI001592B353|nr:hypothetical protein [Kocuria salina]
MDVVTLGMAKAADKDHRGVPLRVFDPVRDVPGTLVHLEADVLAGSNGATVTTWQASFGGFALNRTLASKPTLLTNARNGHKAVRFTPSTYLGNSDTFGSGGLGVMAGWPLPLTFVIVFRVSANWAQNNDAVLFGSTGVNVRMAAAGNSLHVNAGLDSSKYGPPFNDGAWHVAIITIGSGGAAVYVDGFVTTVSGAAVGTNTMDSLFIGPGQGSPPTAGTLDVGEVIVANQPVSPSRADIITQNIAKKWGLS